MYIYVWYIVGVQVVDQRVYFGYTLHILCVNMKMNKLKMQCVETTESTNVIEYALWIWHFNYVILSHADANAYPATLNSDWANWDWGTGVRGCGWVEAVSGKNRPAINHNLDLRHAPLRCLHTERRLLANDKYIRIFIAEVYGILRAISPSGWFWILPRLVVPPEVGQRFESEFKNFVSKITQSIYTFKCMYYRFN